MCIDLQIKKSFPVRTAMTFALLPAGFTVTVENLDAILGRWPVSFRLWKLLGLIGGGANALKSHRDGLYGRTFSVAALDIPRALPSVGRHVSLSAGACLPSLLPVSSLLWALSSLFGGALCEMWNFLNWPSEF